MTENRALPIDALRWARLKDHVADLSAMDPAKRASALAQLPLDATDRHWLQRLASPLLTDDARLLEPHPAAFAGTNEAALRWRPGDTIGRYRIEGLLGRGGMGEVYEARALDGDQIVALKVLRSGLAHTAYARFSDNEQRALRRLDDPRIARFIEAFVTDSAGSCLVLEWVDGEPLQTYCRGRRFSVEARLKLFIEVCHAVASAHQQLIVHRDLKPSNVLVTPDGQIKLLDFGVAKLLDDGNTHTHEQTQTHGDLFTLDYAAPEQVLREPVSTVTDVYALGVLLYRLLTEVSPYVRDDGGSLAKAVLNDPPQRLAAAIERARAAGLTPPMAHVDLDLDRVIARAMEKEPRHRYRSVPELAADVQAVLDGRPISGGGGALYRMRKFTKRHRAMVSAVSVAALALLTATTVSVYSARHAAQQAHRAEVANRFLLTTLDLTDRFSGNNRGDLSLAEVLERAVAQAHVELSDEPAVRADVLVQLSYALQHGGMLSAALAAAREAHTIRTNARDANATERAAATQRMASIEIESGLLDAATGHLDETLRQLAMAGAHERERIEAYTSLGKLASMRGDAAASLRWYQQILPLREALPGDHSMDLAMDYNNLGTGLYNLSRFQEADIAYIHSIGLLRERLGDTHPRIGFVQSGRVSALLYLGRFDEARALLDTAEAVLNADGKPASTLPGGGHTERSRAQLEYFASNYASALRHLEPVLAQMRSASPVSVAGTLFLRGNIEFAMGDTKAAAATFAETNRLYADNGRATHSRRWYAFGMYGVAMAANGDAEQGDAKLNAALAQLAGDPNRVSIEQIDLSLYSGAAARRRGDLAGARAHHLLAEAMQRQIGWLGELGAARVEAELAQDELAAGVDASARRDALARLAHSIEVMQRIGPHDPRLDPLRILQSKSGMP